MWVYNPYFTGSYITNGWWFGDVNLGVLAVSGREFLCSMHYSLGDPFQPRSLPIVVRSSRRHRNKLFTCFA